MPINELRAIATFAKAAELGSLRKAAVVQGVSPQAASQALAQLEQHLGVRLLHRTTRHLALTDEGRQLLEATQPALAALEQALQQARASKDEIAGPLRIVGPRSSFAPILMPVIDAFCQLHPGIQPDVQLDDGIGNWVLDRVDVGFRIGASPEDGVIARKLFPLQLMVCAAPAYLAQWGLPGSLNELSVHRCSAFRHPATGQVLPWHLNIEGAVVNRFVTPALSTNDTELELQAVLAGQVIGQLSNFSAADHIRAGRLVPVLLQHMTDNIGVHVYYGNRKQPTRVRKFIELVVERLSNPASFVLTARELALAEAAGRKAARKRR